MPSIWSSRRALIAALALVTLFLLIRQTSSPVTSKAGSGNGTSSSNLRSYPPPPLGRNKNQQVVNDVSSLSLRRRLEHYFPYELESKFPAYIWQTWKYGPASGHFADKLRPLEASWTEKHPSFVHEVIVDDAAEHLVKYLYASVPEISRAWAALPLPVLKADFFRYLILLARGGIYSDIDTEALKPAREWLPDAFDQTTVGMVVGIEADPDRPDWSKWYARRIQFCQWTIQAKPGHPILRDIVASITEMTLDMHNRGLLRHGSVPLNKSIMEYTGPGIWTDAIFRYFNNRDYFEYSENSLNITVKDFFNIRAQKKVGDVVVLPITSFSPGVGQMGAGERDDPMAFVKHEFEGSWKPDDERR